MIKCRSYPIFMHRRRQIRMPPFKLLFASFLIVISYHSVESGKQFDLSNWHNLCKVKSVSCRSKAGAAARCVEDKDCIAFGEVATETYDFYESCGAGDSYFSYKLTSDTSCVNAADSIFLDGACVRFVTVQPLQSTKWLDAFQESSRMGCFPLLEPKSEATWLAVKQHLADIHTGEDWNGRMWTGMMKAVVEGRILFGSDVSRLEFSPDWAPLEGTGPWDQETYIVVSKDGFHDYEQTDVVDGFIGQCK